jgi:hypothetical protein
VYRKCDPVATASGSVFVDPRRRRYMDQHGYAQCTSKYSPPKEWLFSVVKLVKDIL